MRDHSKFRRVSSMRSGLLPGGKFTGPRTNSKQGGRIPSRMPERQKSDLFKEVQNIKKDIIEMKEMMKGKFISITFQ